LEGQTLSHGCTSSVDEGDLAGEPVRRPGACRLTVQRSFEYRRTVKNFAMITRTIRFLSILVLALTAPPTRAVTIETVPIGNVGNPADPQLDMQGGCCYGTVDHKFRIGLYEVTNDQYVEFLNAVAATDPYELYNDQTATHPRGGIVREGESGSYSYSVKPHFGNKPVNWVGFWDAARFANWMHNGQPVGPQGPDTTEEGAYNLGGVTYPDNDSVTRQEGARWFLPSENEWYKAAYYDPRTEAQGGPPGDDHYWHYATMSDELPTRATSNATGDVTNPGRNVANFDYSVTWNRAVGNVTTVGGAGDQSTSFYGTYDQSGNLWELNDTIIKRSGDRNFRGNRGGNWDETPRLMGSNWRGVAGIEDCGGRWQCFGGSVGFRIARAFSPLDLNGDDQVDHEDIDLLTREVRRWTLNTAYDLNDDGVVNADDRRVWVEDLKNTYFGDSDLNGVFDSSDLVQVLVIGQYEDGLSGNSSWSTGDWDGDGEFGSSDFVFALQAGGFEQGPRTSLAAVPEPAGGLTVPLGLSLLWLNRRRAAGP
jgi:formylglycine-generating enzyme